MSMIKCPECGHDVSSKAVSCPNCGCPIHIRRPDPDRPNVNTYTSPKKKRICVNVTLAGLVLIIISAIIIYLYRKELTLLHFIPLFISDVIAAWTTFYTGHFRRGILRLLTLSFVTLALFKDLFLLLVTGTYKDSNGFPVLY